MRIHKASRDLDSSERILNKTEIEMEKLRIKIRK